MKKEKIVKCPKCGKEWSLNADTAKKQIECPHCHKLMCVDPKTLTKLKVVRYVVMLVIACLFVVAIQNYTKTNNITFTMIVLIFALIMAQYINEWCRAIAFTLFDFNYMDLDEYAKIRKPTIGEKKKGR